MKVIAGGKSSGGGAFLGEVLPQSFWSWLFVYMRSHCLEIKISLKLNPQICPNDTTTQASMMCKLAFWMKAHPKTRRQQMMTPTELGVGKTMKTRSPENYEPKLVEVPGGEKVDERIYDPLMENVGSKQRKEIWINYPMVVSGYRTQKSSSSSMTTKWLDTAKREIPRAKRRNWQSNGYLFPDTVNIKLV